MLRTVPYFTVYKAVVGRHGLDPDGDKLPYPLGRSITRGMNRRTRFAWRAWDWPDFSMTEERAYRQIWNATKQFYRSNPATGLPDELFYIPAIGYYIVNVLAANDPPIGTVPAAVPAPNPPPPQNPAGSPVDPAGQPYFLPLAPLDAYVSMDQICKRSIGRVIGIYKSNPRLDGFKHSGITFRITENGIDLFQVSNPTIFVKYLPAPSKFTNVGWVAGKNAGNGYNDGDLVFYDKTGECYLSIINANLKPPNDATGWRVMPLPEVLAPYVEAGAFADSMRESHPVDQAIAQTAMQAAAAAEEEAKELLDQEIDIYRAMGQHHSYQQHRPPRRWTRSGLITTPAWQPGTVTTLTDVCEPDGLFPPPVGPTAPSWEPHLEIV